MIEVRDPTMLMINDFEFAIVLDDVLGAWKSLHFAVEFQELSRLFLVNYREQKAHFEDKNGLIG